MSVLKPSERSLEDVVPLPAHKPHIEFEALLFSSIDSNLAGPLTLNHPVRVDAKHHYEARKSRHDSKTSHRASLNRSNSLVFRTLPPIRRMPSLQVPSLTDITNPHTIATSPRSLHQISETEPATYKRKLPLTLVHPNSPYVPWEAPERQKILCQLPEPDDEEHEDSVDSSSASNPQEKGELRDGKPLSNFWRTIKTTRKVIKSKCQRLLNPRSREQLPGEAAIPSNANTIPKLTLAPFLPAVPLSPTTSVFSSDTNTLAVWLSERGGLLLDKDCDSLKLMTIDEYERVGSWIRPGSIRPGSIAFSASRVSYQHSFVEEDTVSSVFIMESEADAASIIDQSPFLRTSPLPPGSPSRSPLGSKRLVDEDRLSRLVHRASVRSYFAERPVTTANTWGSSPPAS